MRFFQVEIEQAFKTTHKSGSCLNSCMSPTLKVYHQLYFIGLSVAKLSNSRLNDSKTPQILVKIAINRCNKYTQRKIESVKRHHLDRAYFL